MDFPVPALSELIISIFSSNNLFSSFFLSSCFKILCPFNSFRYLNKSSFNSEKAKVTHDFISFFLLLNNKSINFFKVCFFSELKISIFPITKKTEY